MIDPVKSDRLEHYIGHLVEARKKKGVSRDQVCCHAGRLQPREQSALGMLHAQSGHAARAATTVGEAGAVRLLPAVPLAKTLRTPRSGLRLLHPALPAAHA